MKVAWFETRWKNLLQPLIEIHMSISAWRNQVLSPQKNLGSGNSHSPLFPFTNLPVACCLHIPVENVRDVPKRRLLNGWN